MSPQDDDSRVELEASIPQHVAIIMDGNGRWARRRHLPRVAGHKAGVNAVRKVVEGCAKRGVKVLTLFAFSSENWKRPEQEVGFLMDLFLTALDREVRSLNENNIRIQVIGDLSAFSDALQLKINQAHKLTEKNNGLVLNIAANYGGRWDVVQAAKSLFEDIQRNEVSLDDVDEKLFGSYLELDDLPEPDLFIRTGGEQRISNFLLWNLAYSELYFTELAWPDFDDNALETAISSFRARERRFGKTSEQVQAGA